MGGAGLFAGVGEVASLHYFVFQRAFLPVVCYAEDSLGPFDSLNDRIFGIEIGLWGLAICVEE